MLKPYIQPHFLSNNVKLLRKLAARARACIHQHYHGKHILHNSLAYIQNIHSLFSQQTAYRRNYANLVFSYYCYYRPHFIKPLPQAGCLNGLAAVLAIGKYVNPGKFMTQMLIKFVVYARSRAPHYNMSYGVL